MKFVSGVPRNDGSFRPYTVNDFWKELKALEGCTFKEMVKEFQKRGLKDEAALREFMKFPLDDFNGNTKTHSIFNVQKGKRGDGWAKLISNYFSTKCTDQMINIRKNLLYDVKGGTVDGAVAMDKGKPIHRYWNTYACEKRMFRVFKNDPKNIGDWDPDFGVGHIIIQFFSYRWYKGSWTNMYDAQNVDTKFVITETFIDEDTNEKIHRGHLAVDGVMPYTLDAWLSDKMSERFELKDTVYMLSPEHTVAMGIMDKLKMLTTYKSGAIKPAELANTIRVLTQNCESTEDCDRNLQVQLACRVRLIPYNYAIDWETGEKVDGNCGVKELDAQSSYYTKSHFFNWNDPVYSAKSWSDTFGKSHQFDTEDLEEVWSKFHLRFTFLQETAMLEGIFCIDMPEYQKFLKEDRYFSELLTHFNIKDGVTRSNISSHIIMTNGSDRRNSLIVTVSDASNLSFDDWVNLLKKLNQRKKLTGD